MKRIAIAILALGILAACDDDGDVTVGKACTLTGCRSSLMAKVSLRNALPAKIRVASGGETLIDDCASTTLVAPIKAAMDLDAQRINSREIMVNVYSYGEGKELPTTLNIQVWGRATCAEPEDSLFRTDNEPIAYESFFPNGEKCGGGCKTAQVHIAEI